MFTKSFFKNPQNNKKLNISVFCGIFIYTGFAYLISRHGNVFLEETTCCAINSSQCLFLSLSDLEAVTAGLDARTASLENVTNDHEARLSAVEEMVDGNICQYYHHTF